VPDVEMRVKDLSLADRVDSAEQSWWRVTRPVLSRLGETVSGLDLRGSVVACFQHVLMDASLILHPLVRAGARVRIAAVNPESTDDVAAAYLARGGVEVWAWNGMTEAECREGLDWLLSEPADAVSDMGGEAIEAIALRGDALPAGALEATTSGIHRLAGLDLPFPVFDWNGVPLKDRLHNRFHVGLEAWPAFCDITGLALHGRSVLVIGFGPVGRGVALHARALGALVSVAEVDPVRALEAQHHGCRVVSLDEGLESCSIVVTATGREGVLGPEQLRQLRSGAILANVGHSNREIDVAWLERQPLEPVRRSIDRYTIDGRDVFLINRGNLVNLAPGAGIAIDELFDPFAAIMLHGLAWILQGGAESARPGLQPYPAHLEREIAELTLASRP
jgi:adenosylhomocysteinase